MPLFVALLLSLALHALVFWGELPALRSITKLPPAPRIEVRLDVPENVERWVTKEEKPVAATSATEQVSANAPSTRILRARAQAALSKQLFYPEEAISKGWEGDVMLLLTLSTQGDIIGVELARSSGHAILDNAARTAAGKLGKLRSGSGQLLLPVEFRLD
jgi:protein TonB